MKKVVVLGVVLGVLFGSLHAAKAQPPQIMWGQTYGGVDYDGAYDVQLTTDGGFIVAGYTYSYGVGLSDVYLLKIDESGNTDWTHTFGGPSWDEGYSIQQTWDGGYIIAGIGRSTGFTGQDIFLVKTDSLGNAMWTNTFGGQYTDWCHGVQQTLDNGYILVGESEQFEYLQSMDVILIKTDALGNTEWTRTYGGPFIETVDF
jgi:hypothetical protein